MKGLSILIILVMVSGIVLGQQVFGDSNGPTKDEKQFVSGVYLVGFVGIYGGIIYYRKSMEMRAVPKRN